MINFVDFSSNRVIVIATESNGPALEVAWWIEDSFRVLLYSVSCSAVSATAIHEQNLTTSTNNAINTVRFGQLLSSSKYNCCIAEHTLDGSVNEVCKETKTFPENNIRFCFDSRTVVSLFFVLVVVLLSIIILVIVIWKQGKNAKLMANR